MTVDIHLLPNSGRANAGLPPTKKTSSSGRLPFQARNMNTMRSSANGSSAELTKPGLSTLESSGNEMNKKLTSSASYLQTRRGSENSEVREGAADPPSTGDPQRVPSASVPKAGMYKRSSSSSSSGKPEEEGVIIEEKRKKANGDGYTIHRYLRGKLLGKGGFAKVYLCTAMDTNKMYAIKIVPKANLVKARARQKLQAEIKIHRTLKHEHVCEYKHFFEDRQNCYILLELCHNQSMNELIKRRKRLTEPEAAFFMRQVVEAMQYLHHEQLVIHRDLKLGNLFLDRNMNIKVGDLGLATRLENADDKRKTICGTPNYIAPEVIQGDKATRGHSFEVDIWSMGVILFTVMVGKPPYESKDVKSTYQRILNNEYSFPSKITMSENAKGLISSMLQSKPADRPSLSEISMHPFFTNSFIPGSLPQSVTHVAPKWDTTTMVQDSATGLKKPNEPFASSSRRPLGYRDVNVDPVASDPLKAAKSHIPSIDVPGVVKNVVSAVMGVGSTKNSEKQGAFNVFDETEGNRDEEIVSRTAAMSIRTEPNEVSQRPTPLPSPTSDDAFVLHNMIDRIESVLETTAKRSYANVDVNSISLRAMSTGGPDKWVSRYVDYTSKYGLGFLLSDGSSGVYFNDSTKAISEPEGDCFQYIERSKVSMESSRRGEPVVASHSLAKYPDILQKKVTLLKHFRNYLIEQQKKADEFETVVPSSPINSNKRDMVYLKKWVRTKHAIFFRLSDNTVQIVFYDHTEILLTPDERHITYADKQRQRKTYYLTDELVGTNSEINKRLKYTKEILLQLVTGKSPR
eukprot:CAMPEP_0113633260 /NCGR_PEP_ID=MMETSP0017_2-20120614/17309_1 /TAXON_ID=2856 /ORGANISM="Cylindrotheca closterium" /LENGTH=799 /DNA_ID=CAMNT_0000543891 /DNA_START=56 /DNA_END=2455 /DNA_ORIENTATION=- /assembly_acc=CAM_ASM_000147